MRFVLISWRAEKFCQGAHWMFSRVMMRKRINDDQDEYIYIYIICEYVAECDNDEWLCCCCWSYSFLVASVVVNDDGQLWRLHKMGLPHATIHVHMIFHYIYKQSILGYPYFLETLMRCFSNAEGIGGAHNGHPGHGRSFSCWFANHMVRSNLVGEPFFI